MIIDHENRKDSNKIIEVLIEDPDSNISVWIPALASRMYAVGNDGSMKEVKEIQIRELNEP